MKSFATADFWRAYDELSPDMKAQARKAYKLWKENSLHPSLHFKKVGKKLWSARVSGGYRALDLKETIIIGSGLVRTTHMKTF